MFMGCFTPPQCRDLTAMASNEDIAPVLRCPSQSLPGPVRVCQC
ncbi:hypothetical protein Nmel_001761 [Mimus melanotis]